MSKIITYEVSAEYVKNNSTIDYEAEKKLYERKKHGKNKKPAK